MNNLFYIFLGIGVLLISFFPLYDLVWKLINYLFFPDKPIKVIPEFIMNMMGNIKFNINSGMTFIGKIILMNYGKMIFSQNWKD